MNPTTRPGAADSPGSTLPEFSSIGSDAEADLCRRRDFLKILAGVIGGSALALELPWLSLLSAQPAGVASSDRVRLAIIGTGSRGNFLLDHLLRTPGVEVTALCDTYRPHLDRAMAKVANRARGFDDHRRLLARADVDGVLIATPLHEHAPACLDAFAADKHVFCEKSFGYTIEECKEMARAAAASRRVFQIGHQRLFSPPFLEAHRLVRAGTIGDITQIRAYWHRNGDWRTDVPSPELERHLNWRLYRASSCGLMTELASHHLHVANWFLDAYPLSCVGYGSINHWKDGREVHDTVNVIYRYRDGVHLVYDSLISNRFHGLEIQIMGPKGTIEGETGKWYLENPPPAPAIVQLLNQLERSVFDTIPIGGPSWVPDLQMDTQGSWLTRNLKGDDGSALSLAAFVNAVRLGERMPYMIEHAYRAGVAALMGQIAMEEGREVTWPGDYTG
jgi:predicted dehydrogenase